MACRSTISPRRKRFSKRAWVRNSRSGAAAHPRYPRCTSEMNTERKLRGVSVGVAGMGPSLGHAASIHAGDDSLLKTGELFLLYFCRIHHLLNPALDSTCPATPCFS